MGNFISDLGKGFVRSAVNQVGRDGGRVISNAVYGDAHAIPIRGIYQSKNNQYFDDTTNEVVSPEELRRRAEEEGFKVSVCKYKTSAKVVWYIISLFFSFILLPSIVLFVFGIKKFFQKHIFMCKKITSAQYTSDKRYKTGKRLNGYVEQEIKIKAPCTPSEKGALIKIGILYIILSFISFYLGTTITKLSQEDSAMRKYTQFVERAQNEKNAIEIISNGDSVEYKKRMDDFNKKYQEAIEYIENHKK